MCISVPLAHANGDLFARKKVRVTPQTLRAVNGVVIGYGHSAHVQPLQPVIDSAGWFRTPGKCDSAGCENIPDAME